MTYNIPGVFTSVIDRSYVQPMIVEGRSVLIAGFSKYGEDKFYNFADADTMKFTLGDIDIKRYGLGLMYGIDTLTKTRNLIFKRLMPSDALFANLLFKTDNSTVTRDNIIDPDTIKAEIDADEGLTVPPIEPKELEVIATDGQESVFIEYNPKNVAVYLNGFELSFDSYSAQNGQQIVFSEPIRGDKIINVYTVLENYDPADGEIEWVRFEYISPDNRSTINVEYDPNDVWITVNGIELMNSDYTATDGQTIEFHIGGIGGDGLVQHDVVHVHSAINNTIYEPEFHIHEMQVQEDNTVVLDVKQLTGHEYNTIFTLVTVEGVVLGRNDYLADDGVTLRFSTPLSAGQKVRLHSVKPGDYSHIFGALIAKASGEGYNDLFVQFRPAYDIEKYYSDEEGDVRYKFNFLKATIFEQTVNGQRKVSDEFPVSLINEDPVSLMPIISTITGESLYINDKFKESNDFLEFYLNESFLPEFYKDLSIDELTKDALGTPGANRLILKDVGIYGRNKNIELVVNSMGEFEKKSTIIPGKEAVYTYYNDPMTGERKTVSIRIANGLVMVSDEGTLSNPIHPLYIDGISSFYESYIMLNPHDPDDKVFDPNSKYVIGKIPHVTLRQKLYNQLIGNGLNQTLWQMQGGFNGENLIRDGRLNLGYVPGSGTSEDAKQLLIEFFNNNEVIHEVLYPELDFDYVPDWTQDIDVMNAIVEMADEIGFTMPLISLPREIKPEDDYLMRIEEVYLSSYNTAIYSGQNNDNHYMAEMGTRITCPSNYYALLNHLQTDEEISITEPMANIVKGQLPVAGAKLSYIAKSADIERLRGVQINTIIKEIDGIYFIDQLTAYKSASKLSRINVVKVIHRMRKDLPKILKDLLQRKALENVLLSAKTRTEKYMARWLVTDSNTTDGIFSEINVTPMFVEEELKLIVSVAVRPIGTIEKIEVPITVY